MALLGEIGGCKFFIGANQFEVWNHQQFIVDVAPIRGGMFSTQGSHGLRFFTRSSILSAEEFAALKPGRCDMSLVCPPGVTTPVGGQTRRATSPQ
jgi:Protein of unknown function (DUF779)